MERVYLVRMTYGVSDKPECDQERIIGAYRNHEDAVEKIRKFTNFREPFDFGDGEVFTDFDRDDDDTDTLGCRTVAKEVLGRRFFWMLFVWETTLE